MEPVFSSEIQSRSIHGHGRGEEFVVHKVEGRSLLCTIVFWLSTIAIAQPPSLPAL
jgi:hypothetical protein